MACPLLNEALMRNHTPQLGLGLQVQRLLGRGGMGEVWLAYEKRTKRHVAVKLARRDVDEPRWTESLFLEELRVLRGLREVEGVSRLHWTGVLDGRVFGVMDHVDGPSLREALRVCGRPSRAVTARLIDELGAVLQRVHRRGVVHRDLKPSNVLLSDGQPVLIDFGVALAPDPLVTPTVDVAWGALDYLSPEQLLGGHLDANTTDLWSLAVVAYELITGKRPFEQEGVRRHCVAVLAADFERTGDHALDAFFHRALAPQQQQRFRTLDIFLTAWRAVLPEPAAPREVTDWLAPHSRLAHAA